MYQKLFFLIIFFTYSGFLNEVLLIKENIPLNWALVISWFNKFKTKVDHQPVKLRVGSHSPGA